MDQFIDLRTEVSYIEVMQNEFCVIFKINVEDFASQTLKLTLNFLLIGKSQALLLKYFWVE